MKQCLYCGCENNKKAVSCDGCGEVLAQDNVSLNFQLFSVWWQKPLPVSIKNWLWWGIVVVAWFCIHPAAIIYLPFFPIGLVGDGVLSDFLWLFYLGMTVFALRTKTRWGYFLFYVPFGVVLLLNAAGCHKIMADLSRIQ